MTRISDYGDRMSLSSITNEELEEVLRGESRRNDLSVLAAYFEILREIDTPTPDPATIEWTAVRAAAVARSNNYSVSESSKPALWQRLLERSTAVFASIAVIFALSGIAVAADTSIPGDALYGLDIAMEKIGIGAGSMDERLLEAEKLA
ncbi:MAG: hypothetical protein DWQ40_10430, partial [Actinobacteria bacterium]